MRGNHRRLSSLAVALGLVLIASTASAQTKERPSREYDERRAERDHGRDDAFKMRLGATTYTAIMTSVSHESAYASGLGSNEIGVGAHTGDHTMLSAQVGVGLGLYLSGEFAVSAEGWHKDGLIFWGGAGYTLVPAWCEGDDPSCPPSPEYHGPMINFASGALFYAGLGYRWSFSRNEWALMLGVGEGLAYLQVDPNDYPDATEAQLDALAGWYVSVPMVRCFLEW